MVLAPPNPATRIIEEPGVDVAPFEGNTGSIIINVSTAADAITPWGSNWRLRDSQLRSFWPTEDVFASALFTVVAQYTAFEYALEGPPRMVGIVQDMLNNVQMGKGLSAFLVPWLIDYHTQDNGAFMEVVRTDDNPRAPVVTFNHLDAHRCIRTGRHEEPVIYIDLKGKWHKLKWYQVIASNQFPSPLEEARGLGYSCLTRVLRTAQTMRDIEIVKQEKAGGRFTRQIHLVSGVQASTITNAIAQKERMAIEAGWNKFVQSTIVASLDPTARVSKETIDLASIPDDYDEEKSLQTYLLILALGFGTDYQNFAPLPGGGLGSSSQSKILNMKSRGKGPGLYMREFAQLMNFHGLLPRSVKFRYGDQDVAAQMEKTELRKSRAELRETLIRSGEITTEVARQMAVDDGDMSEHYLVMMREENATEEIVGGPDERVDTHSQDHVTPGMPGPKEAPKAAPPEGTVSRPENSNAKRPRNPATNQRRTPGGTPEGGARA